MGLLCNTISTQLSSTARSCVLKLDCLLILEGWIFFIVDIKTTLISIALNGEIAVF